MTARATEPPSGSSDSRTSLRRAVQWSALAIAAASSIAAAAAAWLRPRAYAQPSPGGDVFIYLYSRHEQPFFILLAAFAVCTWLYTRTERATDAGQPGSTREWLRRSPGGGALLAAAAAFGVLSALGTQAVLHGLPLSMDEFNAVFQAKILAAGHLRAPVGPEWQPFARGLTPIFVTYYPDEHVWRSGYLPVYAAIHSLFLRAGAGSITNPVLAALTVLVLGGVGRRLWPSSPERGWLAVLFLVTSSQVLFMSMTWYSMPAHLLLNLVWLWLYLRNDRPSLAAAPVVGALALGLHNPFPHALFVTPFLIRMLRERRWGWLAYFGVVYGAGALVWYSWLRASPSYLQATGGEPTGGLLSTFALPGSWQFKFQALQLSLLLSWQAPLVAILILVALAGWRRIGNTERDLAVGLVLTGAFHFLFPLTQLHGWGYRYIYSALGNAIILAAAGAGLASTALGRRRLARLVAASTVIALAVQWPLRARQIERFVGPFARAQAFVESRDAAAVIVYEDSSYYGRDLVRNDPFLRNSPKILSAQLLGDSGIRALSARFGRRVHRVQKAELARLGVITF